MTAKVTSSSVTSVSCTRRHKATGRPANVRAAHHFVVRAGPIVCFEQFVDIAKVRTMPS